jgi:surface antigen
LLACLLQASAEAIPGDLPWQGPPLPGAASSLPLSHIQSIRLESGRLQVIAQPGEPLRIKTQFILDNPNRLVIDIENATLDKQQPTLPDTQDTIGGVPVDSIRLGQFELGTVRVVIETPEPERLRLSVSDNALIVSADKGRGLISSLYKHLFGHETPPPAPTQSPVSRAPGSPARNPATRGTLSRSISGSAPTSPQMDAPPTTTSMINLNTFHPELDNLHKLQLQQAGLLSQWPPRTRIIEMARAQIGFSKDINRDYINQTYSKGRDNEWCADFASTILEWSGGSPWGHLSRVQDIYHWGLSNSRVSNRPEVGDLVVFSYDGSSFSHIAFVESINPDNTITTIGGNEGYAAADYKTGGTVARSIYNLDDKRIFGFVDPVASTGNTLSPTTTNAHFAPF